MEYRQVLSLVKTDAFGRDYGPDFANRFVVQDRSFCARDIYNKGMDGLASAVSRIRIESGYPQAMTPGREVKDRDIVTYHREHETGGLIETATSPSQNHVTARSLNSVGDLRQAFPNLDRVLKHGNLEVAPNYRSRPTHIEYPRTKISMEDDQLLMAFNDHVLFRQDGQNFRYPKVLVTSDENQRVMPDIEACAYQTMSIPASKVFLVNQIPTMLRPRHQGSTSSLHPSDRAPSSRGDVTPHSSPKTVKARPALTRFDGPVNKSSTCSSPRLVRRATLTSVQSLTSAQSSGEGRTSPRKMNQIIKDKKARTKKRNDAKQRKKTSRSQSLQDVCTGELTGVDRMDRRVNSSLIVTVPGPGSNSGEELSTGQTETMNKQVMELKRDGLKSYGVESATSRANMSPDHGESLPTWSNMADRRPAQYGDFVYLDQNGQLFLSSGYTGGEFYPHYGGYMYYPAIDPVYHDAYTVGDIAYNSNLAISDNDGNVSFRDHLTRCVDKPGEKLTSKIERRSRGYTKDDVDLYTRSWRGKRNSNLPRRSRSISPSLQRRRYPLYRRKPRSDAVKRRNRKTASTEDNSNESRGEDEYCGSSFVETSTTVVSKSPLRDRKSDDYFSNGASQMEQEEEFSYSAPESCRFNVEPEAACRSGSAAQNPYHGFPSSNASGPLDKLLRNTRLNLATMRTYLDAMSSSLASLPTSSLSSLSHRLQQTDTLEHVEAQDFFKARPHDQIVASPNVVPIFNTEGEQTYAVCPNTQVRSVKSNTVIEDYLGDPVLPYSRAQKMSQQPVTRLYNSACPDQDIEDVLSLNYELFTDYDLKNSVNTPDNAHVKETVHRNSEVDKGIHVGTFVNNPVAHPVFAEPSRATEMLNCRQDSLQNWILKPTRTSAAQTEKEMARHSSPLPSPPPPPPPSPLHALQPTKSAHSSVEKQGLMSPRSTKSLSYEKELRARVSTLDRQRNKSCPPPVLPKPSWALQRLHSQKSLLPTSLTTRDMFHSEDHETSQILSERSFITNNLCSLSEQTPAPNYPFKDEALDRPLVKRSFSVRERIEEFSNFSASKNQSFTQQNTRHAQPKMMDFDKDAVYPHRSPATSTNYTVYPYRTETLPKDKSVYQESDSGVQHGHTEHGPTDLPESMSAYKQSMINRCEAWTSSAAQGSPTMGSSPLPVEPPSMVALRLPSNTAETPHKRCPIHPPVSTNSTVLNVKPILSADITSQAQPLHHRPDRPEQDELDESTKAPSTPTTPFGGVKLPGFPALPPPTRINGHQTSDSITAQSPESSAMHSSNTSIKLFPKSSIQHSSSVTAAIRVYAATPRSQHQEDTSYQMYRGSPGLLAALNMKTKSKSEEDILSGSSKLHKRKKRKSSREDQSSYQRVLPFPDKTISPSISTNSVYEITESGFTLYKGIVSPAQHQKSEKITKHKKKSKSTVYPCPTDLPLVCPNTPIARPNVIPLNEADSITYGDTNRFSNAPSSSPAKGISDAQLFHHDLEDRIPGGSYASPQVSAIDGRFPPRAGVPIPPRDFDSDADSSEYINTSQGWSHMLQHLPDQDAAIFYCHRVEDKSSEFWTGNFRKCYWDLDIDTCSVDVESHKSLGFSDFAISKKTERNDGLYLDEYFDKCVPLLQSKDRILPCNFDPVASFSASELFSLKEWKKHAWLSSSPRAGDFSDSSCDIHAGKSKSSESGGNSGNVREINSDYGPCSIDTRQESLIHFKNLKPEVRNVLVLD